jgi:transposase
MPSPPEDSRGTGADAVAKVTNGPTEAINNLIERITRIGFGFRRLRHYRIRALLYAGRPNWALLATIAPR